MLMRINFDIAHAYTCNCPQLTQIRRRGWLEGNAQERERETNSIVNQHYPVLGLNSLPASCMRVYIYPVAAGVWLY